MSVAAPLPSEALPSGVNVMLGPVGNWPHPDVTVSVAGTVLLIGVPLESTTVTFNQASWVPSTAVSVVVLELSLSPAGLPETGHVGGATFA
jgi:hypothetical protein